MRLFEFSQFRRAGQRYTTTTAARLHHVQITFRGVVTVFISGRDHERIMNARQARSCPGSVLTWRQDVDGPRLCESQQAQKARRVSETDDFGISKLLRVADPRSAR